MQILKIALVRAKGNQNVSSVKEILEYMDTDIYRFIDSHGVKAFYQYLEQEYRKRYEHKSVVPPPQSMISASYSSFSSRVSCSYILEMVLYNTAIPSSSIVSCIS